MEHKPGTSRDTPVTQIRAMTIDDIPLGMRLRQQAGWNQTEDDWRRFLTLQPDGCFVAERDGTPVATTTTCLFDDIGWIAMVLVEQTARHRGIATRLVEHAIEFLSSSGARTIRLDATPLGRPVYERLGFSPEYELVRLQGTARSVKPVSPQIAACDRSWLDRAAALDQQATGTARMDMLRMLLVEWPEAAFVAARQDELSGYVFCRRGSNATLIGPAAARDRVSGEALLDGALDRCAGQPVFVDIPCENRPAMDWAAERGLAVQRPFTRMFRGKPIPDNIQCLWASSGPEKG